jgi:acetyl-CoA carboxylase biotin carboxyl carrier protein
MNVDLLQQLVGLMSAHELNNVELRDGDRRIILSRGAQQQLVSYAAPVAAAPAAVHAAPAASAPATAASAPAAPAASAAADDSNLIPIKSPMVGTYYSRPSPDAPAFVSAGTTVDEESDVCIIEAMKVFNNIKAEVRGTIARVLVEDRQAVEFGTVLFLVKPA